MFPLGIRSVAWSEHIVLFVEVAQTSASIAQTSARKKKVAILAELLVRVAPDERAIAARYLSGDIRHKLGIGYATVGEMRNTVPPAAAASLSLTEVDARLAAIAAMGGSGSNKARKDAYGAMLALSTDLEQRFLGALVIGELRQGALDALVVDAVAQATSIEAKKIRTAYMLAADIGVVTAAAFTDGLAGVERFGLTIFRPVLPMLAQTAEDTAEALANFSGEPMSFELKLDGFRVQIHKAGDSIRAFSRALNDVTASVPEVIAAVRALPSQKLILDGEAIAYGPNGRPLPFQDTMKRKSETGGALSLSLFDILLADDQTMLGTPARERF